MMRGLEILRESLFGAASYSTAYPFVIASRLFAFVD